VLNEGVRASAGLRSQRLSRALVVTEIALAFTLLAVSAVLIGHVRSLSRVPPGFDPAHLLTFQLTVPESIASKGEKRAPYQIALLESIKAIPGVTGAGFVNQLPLGGCCFGTTLYPDGRPPAATGETVAFLPVSPGYFQTMRIPLRAGRLLTYQDVSDDFLFAVINQAAAKRYWPDVNPLGAWGRLSSPTGSRFQVVGVVGDVRNDGLGKPTVPEIYMLASLIHVNPMYFVVRSPMSADALVPLVRRAVQAVDASQPLYNVASMDEIATQSLTFQRAGSFMITFFAAAALMLATLGVYGVVSYSVRQRTVEIGTRMALGALNRDLFSLVLGRGLKMAAYGTLLGAVAIVGAAWLLVRYLDIHELGMLPFAASTLIVGALAGFASFFPAWRAIRVSPLASIRNEPGSIWKSIRHATDSPAAVEAPVLTSFVDASRAAGSFPDALRMALESLKADLGATSAILIEDLSGHAFLQKRLKAYPYPLPVTEGDLETWLRWAKESRPEYVAELEALKNTGIRLAAALRTRDDIIGSLLLGAPVTREQYSYGERESVRHASQQLALMLENARLTQRVVEQEKLRRDLALASEVQRRLLPDKPPHPESADVAAVSLPARTIGGDYYDFIDVGDRCIGIALADIAGKGVAAALIMSVVQASLRIICSEEGISLPQIVAKLNRFLHKSTGTSSYATFFYAQLDDRTRQLRYVNAGHNPPYLLRGTEVLELPAGGTVVGLFPQMAYEEASLNLRPGDLLVAFTDGVTEALSPAEEEFGEDRLKALMREIAHMPVQEISARLSAELKNWIKDAAQYDDLTFVVLKVN
jgi:serine phosphatase RsbU (regulator of sigma subunit)